MCAHPRSQSNLHWTQLYMAKDPIQFNVNESFSRSTSFPNSFAPSEKGSLLQERICSKGRFFTYRVILFRKDLMCRTVNRSQKVILGVSLHLDVLWRVIRLCSYAGWTESLLGVHGKGHYRTLQLTYLSRKPYLDNQPRILGRYIIVCSCPDLRKNNKNITENTELWSSWNRFSHLQAVRSAKNKHGRTMTEERIAYMPYMASIMHIRH